MTAVPEPRPLPERAFEVGFHLDPTRVVEVFRRVLLEHANKSGGVVASETQLVPRGVEQLS